MTTTSILGNEESLIRRALAQLLQQDVCTSYLDKTITHKISDQLMAEYNVINNMLLSFSKSTDFRQERTNLQTIGMKFRILMSRTLAEFVETNSNINQVSPDQMTFIQNLVVMGGKLQSYTQLMATVLNQTKIYDRIREAAILNELDGQDALEYLRRSRDSSQIDNPTRSDIKEVVTTTKTFANLVGIDNIVTQLQLILANIEIGLVDSFIFFILYGIPGTGKTALSEAIASQFSNGEYYKFDQSFFSSTYLGVTESRIRNIFEQIRSNPTKRYTIVIDEADNVLGQSVGQSHLNNVKILLQTEIGSYSSFGNNLIIVAITNYRNQIDQTFLRRATNTILVPPPSHIECLRFLENQLTPTEVPFREEYRNSLEFRNDYVYTNSDMGRLAKNVRDTFLSTGDPAERIEIRLYPVDQIIYFYSADDKASYPINLPTSEYFVFSNNYGRAMSDLRDKLVELNTTLKQYKKYFAPNRQQMVRALMNSSSLREVDAAKYQL